MNQLRAGAVIAILMVLASAPVLASDRVIYAFTLFFTSAVLLFLFNIGI